jgi:hypothetical protein
VDTVSLGRSFVRRDLLVFGWCEVVEARVAALAVVEAFDVVEDGGAQLRLVGLGAAIDEVALECLEERLADGVDAPIVK